MNLIEPNPSCICVPGPVSAYIIRTACKGAGIDMCNGMEMASQIKGFWTPGLETSFRDGLQNEVSYA